MHKSAPWLALCLLSACGMKGDLVLPEAPAKPAAQDQPAPGAPVAPPAQGDEPKRRGVNPPSPDPDLVP